MINGEILLSEITYNKIQQYYAYLTRQGIDAAGEHSRLSHLK